MEYKYNKDVIQSIRVENKGGNIILLKDPHYQLVVNQSAFDIFNLLEKYNNTEQIIDDIEHKYLDMESSVIKDDVLDIMKNFELFGILELIDDIKVENNVIYNITGDTNYKFVSQFINRMIEDSSSTKYYLMGKEDYYSPVQMRMRTMQSNEFGVYCQKNDKIHAYISMSFDDVSVSKVIQIKSIFFDSDTSNLDFKELFLGMIEYSIKNINEIIKISKIRLTFCDCEEHRPFIKLLENCGMVKECVLKDETIKGDLIYLTMFVDKIFTYNKAETNNEN